MPLELPLHGKTIVITGATSGIGLAAARELAGQGAEIIGVGRSQERCQAAEDTIRVAYPNAKVSYLLADLSSQAQVNRLSSQIQEQLERDSGGKLDVLVNNAAMVTNWYTATEDGYETQFAVNHLAVFLMTMNLIPWLKNAPNGRVITVSSASHRYARIRWQDVMHRIGYNTLLAYQQSKLANVLFTVEFNRRNTPDSRVQAFAVDPGLVNTEIGLKGTSGIVRWVWDHRRGKGTTPENGAATIVHLASLPDVQPPGAVYWRNCCPARPSRSALNTDDSARLWALSERLCGLG
jgi:NAD(P)-dependent dehydrogenase (short-subunit alcohol dehydrogenase family)